MHNFKPITLEKEQKKEVEAKRKLVLETEEKKQKEFWRWLKKQSKLTRAEKELLMLLFINRNNKKSFSNIMSKYKTQFNSVVEKGYIRMDECSSEVSNESSSVWNDVSDALKKVVDESSEEYIKKPFDLNEIREFVYNSLKEKYKGAVVSDKESKEIVVLTETKQDECKDVQIEFKFTTN